MAGSLPFVPVASAASATRLSAAINYQGALVSFIGSEVRLTLNGVTRAVATDSASRLIPEFQELASVSPDGKTLLYVTADNQSMHNTAFTTVDLTTLHKRVIASLGSGFWTHQPLWSPDSTWILYPRAAAGSFAPQLWVMRADGTHQQLVVAGGDLTHRSLEGFAVTAPQWSADGKSIIFYDSAFKPTTEWIVSLATGKRTSIPAPNLCINAVTGYGVSPFCGSSGGICYVPNYQQSYQYWSNDIMQSAGETIGNAGCALTSLTMLFDYFQSIDGHTQIGDPRAMNNCLGNYADGPNGIDWVAAQVNPTAGPGCDHYTSNWINQVGFNWSTLDSYLRSGWPVIVGGCWNSVPNCGWTHWVVVVGGNGSDNTYYYWINDPSDGQTKHMSQLTNFTFMWMSLYQNGAGTGPVCE